MTDRVAGRLGSGRVSSTTPRGPAAEAAAAGAVLYPTMTKTGTLFMRGGRRAPVQRARVGRRCFCRPA
jgi:hypothetical protein